MITARGNATRQFALQLSRLPTAPDRACQPSLSRFENSVNLPSLQWLRGVFSDSFIAAFAAPPRHLLFDRDAVDDPAHGPQQLVLLHGDYEQYQ